MSQNLTTGEITNGDLSALLLQFIHVSVMRETRTPFKYFVSSDIKLGNKQYFVY